MSVEKITQIGGFTRLIQDGISYTVSINQVTRHIKSLEAKGLYHHLLSKPDDWHFYRSQLCHELNIGKDKLTKYLNELISMGLVTETELRDTNGRFLGSELKVSMGIEVKLSLPQADFPAPAKPASGKPAPTKRKTFNKEKDKTNICPSEDGRMSEHEILEKTFERFWEIYPVRKKKKRAKHIWLKIGQTKYGNNTYERIFVDIPYRLKNDPAWSDPKFIPLPDTYLNGERWCDEIIPLNKKTVVPIKPIKSQEQIAADKALQDKLAEESVKSGLRFMESLKKGAK